MTESQHWIGLLSAVLPMVAFATLLPWGASEAQASQLFAHQPITLFQGPGEGFREVVTIPADRQLRVLWCNGDANWCLVQAEAGQGWAPSAALTSGNTSNADNPGAGQPAANSPAGSLASKALSAAASATAAAAATTAQSLATASGAVSATGGAVGSATGGVSAAVGGATKGLAP